MTRRHSITALLIAAAFGTVLATGCSAPKQQTAITRINRMSVSDMEQLSHVGNIWMSEQPTEKDLRWMRDNYVTMVIDTRGREEERGFDERAYVVSLGMKYRLEPLDTSQDYTIRYFDIVRGMLRSRTDVPTLIHGESADRAAAVWLPYRILDQNVDYSTAMAEARIAGLENEETIRIVNQYLMSRGVDVKHPVEVSITAEDGPDETIFHVEEADKGSSRQDDRESVRD